MLGFCNRGTGSSGWPKSIAHMLGLYLLLLTRAFSAFRRKSVCNLDDIGFFQTRTLLLISRNIHKWVFPRVRIGNDSFSGETSQILSLRAKTYSNEGTASPLKACLAVYTESWSQHHRDRARTKTVHDEKIPKPEINSTCTEEPRGAAYTCYLPHLQVPSPLPMPGNRKHCQHVQYQASKPVHVLGTDKSLAWCTGL